MLVRVVCRGLLLVLCWFRSTVGGVWAAEDDRPALLESHPDVCPGGTVYSSLNTSAMHYLQQHTLGKG